METLLLSRQKLSNQSLEEVSNFMKEIGLK